MTLYIVLAAGLSGFEDFIQHYGYLGIFIWFITFDQLTPLPEEISLIVLGYFIAHHTFNPVFAGIASIAGFLVVDIAYYFLARTGAHFIKTRKRKRKHSKFIDHYKDMLRKQMLKALIILAFIPRVRLSAPIIVGGMKLPFGKFLLYDAIGLTLHAIVYIVVGVIFHASLSKVFVQVTWIQHVILAVSVALAVIAAAVVIYRKVKAKS